jgi:hypothetical protein
VVPADGRVLLVLDVGLDVGLGQVLEDLHALDVARRLVLEVRALAHGLDDGHSDHADEHERQQRRDPDHEKRPASLGVLLLGLHLGQAGLALLGGRHGGLLGRCAGRLRDGCGTAAGGCRTPSSPVLGPWAVTLPAQAASVVA